jgi:hypothetical protein
MNRDVRNDSVGRSFPKATVNCRNLTSSPAVTSINSWESDVQQTKRSNVFVRDRELALGQAEGPTKADGDQTGPQCMRHRLTHAEVGSTRETGSRLRPT